MNIHLPGMNIHLPAILMFTRGTRFWHTATCQIILLPLPLEVWTSSDNGSTETLNADFVMASQINSGTVLPWDFRYTSQFPKNFFARSPCLESATWGCSWAYQWLQYYYIYTIYIYTLYIYIYYIMYELCIYVYTVCIYIYYSHGDNLHKLGYICININVPVKNIIVIMCVLNIIKLYNFVCLVGI